MSLLSIQNLSLAIGTYDILHDVSLNVAPGEIVAITGESGSGKSMTALATMGLLPAAARTRGQILLDGEDLLALTEAQMCGVRGARIGMVFQEPMTALNPVMTIGTQVAETILQHESVTRTEALERARQVLARVGLPEDRFPLTRYPHELSGGQRQRVVIAMAIALRPRLLIADEPTTALDVTTQARILDLLKDLTQDFGMGLMMITHDLAVVSDMADRIVVMQHGRVVESGPTQQLFHAMQHPYTRALFAASTHRVDLPPAPPPVPLLKVWEARGVALQQGYGMTETSPAVMVLDREDAARKAGSSGKPVLHTEVRIVRPDGSDADVGELGELWVKGPNVTPGYWNRPDANQSSFTDGWLHTGDATRIDEDGFYYIVDRWKDMYISGGENVYPAEVESVLHQLSAVAEAAIIGIPNEQWGEVGMAVIAVKPGHALTPAEIHAHCAANLAKFKCPRLVEFVDALPRNATGKIHKPTLRKQFSVAKPTDASAAAS
mgnify:CR=1 FL=1